MRALTAGPQLRNDVVVVLTDAEEACLCGAEAFAASHPLAASGGVVLNFEARGTTGPPIMFETSRGNADLAGVFAEAAPHPVATSFAVEVYRALPNDTDFSVLLADGGFTGLNTAYIDGAAAYHTPQDRPERHGPGEPAGDGRQRAGPGPGARRPRPRRRWPQPSAERRHLLPGARPAGPLPGQPRLAAGRARRCSPSPSWRSSCAGAGDQLAAPDGGRHRAGPAADRAGPARRAGAVVAAGR